MPKAEGSPISRSVHTRNVFVGRQRKCSWKKDHPTTLKPKGKLLPSSKKSSKKPKNPKEKKEKKGKGHPAVGVGMIPTAKVEEEVAHRDECSVLYSVPCVTFGVAWITVLPTLFKILVLLCSLFVRVGDEDKWEQSMKGSDPHPSFATTFFRGLRK